MFLNHLRYFIFMAISLTTQNLCAAFFSDWSEHKEPTLYGSEREEKVPIRLLLFELEDWQDHYRWEALFLLHSTDYPKYSSFTLFPLFHSKSSKIENKDRLQVLNYFQSNENNSSDFFLFPFFYNKTILEEDQNSRENFSLLHYFYTDDDSLQWLLPAWYYNRNLRSTTYATLISYVNTSHLELTVVLPGWWYSRTETQYQYAAPLLYVQRSEQSRSTLVGPYWNSVTDSSSSFHMMPFWFSFSEQNSNSWLAALLVYYKNRRSSNDSFKMTNLYILPLFFKTENFWAILPFYATSREPDENPENPSANSVSHYGLFYYFYQDPITEITWLGPWYSRKENGITVQKNLVPLYWHWEGERDRGELWLPFTFDYTSARKSIHLDLIGIFWNRSAGSLIPASAGTSAAPEGVINQNEYWYLETEISWLYNIFSIASRVPMRGDLITAEIIADHQPTVISPDTRLSKETSLRYYSLQFLFGLYGWEKVDERRHFRAFPLAWLTWSEKDDERLAMTPLFFSYHAEELDYFTTLPVPLYGYVRDKTDWFKAYGLIAFWQEDEFSRAYHERSILWPLVNWYYDDNSSGSRFLPLWIQGTEKTTTNSSAYFLSLLFSQFENSSEFQNAEALAVEDNEASINEEEKNNKNNWRETSTTRFAPVIPLLYYSTSSFWQQDDDSTDSHSMILPFLLYYTNTEINQSGNHSARDFSIYNPLWFYFDDDESKTVILPLFISGFYRSTEKEWSLIGGVAGWGDEVTQKWSMLLPLYYQSTDIDRKATYTLGYYSSEDEYTDYWNAALLMSREKHKMDNSTEYCFALCLITADFMQNESSFSLGYYLGGYLNLQDDSHVMHLGLLYWQSSGSSLGNFLTTLIPIYFYADFNSGFVLTTLPLLSLSYHENSDKFDMVLLGTLFYRDYSPSQDSSTYFLLGTLYEYRKLVEKDYHSYGSFWGLLWQYQEERANNWKKFSILKLLFSITTSKNTSKVRLLGIPIYSY